MRNVEYGMGHKCEREDRQRVSWIADHRRTGDDQESDRERNLWERSPDGSPADSIVSPLDPALYGIDPLNFVDVVRA